MKEHKRKEETAGDANRIGRRMRMSASEER